jgi:hypothetical protein
MYNKQVLIDSLKKLNSAKKPTVKKDNVVNPSSTQQSFQPMMKDGGINEKPYKNVTVKKSNIQGNGLFANEPIKAGEIIGLTHIRSRFMKNGQPWLKSDTTAMGKKYNHSEDQYNTDTVNKGNKRYLRALRDIQPGEELTANYRFDMDDPTLENPDDFLGKAKSGGSAPRMPKKKSAKSFSRNIESTNKFFTEHPFFAKPKSKRNKIYDPNSIYYQNGGITYNNLPPTYLEALQRFTDPNISSDYSIEIDPETGEEVPVYRTGYNALNDTITQNPNDPIENMDNDWWREHEMFHHLQNLAGGLSTYGITGLRPNPYVASDESIGAYYDRRDSDVNRTIDRMIQQDPNLQFIPRNKLAEGAGPGFIGAEDLQYSDPSTLEGEARNYEGYIREGNPSIFPQKQNGGPANTAGPRAEEEYIEEYPTDSFPQVYGNEPEDYQKFLDYNKTAPENRRGYDDYKYGDPNSYDHYGMWDALGKPKDFEEALQMNPDWQPDPYDGYYHGFSVNPNTGVFLKSGKPGLKPGDTTWMEIKDHYLSPRSNESTPVFDPELQRFKYIPKQKDGGLVQYAPGGDWPPRWLEDGGIITELDKNEIQKYVDGGYIIEDADDPSIPSLNRFDNGGASPIELPKGYNQDTANKNIEFLKSMANSPLFVERYARMVGKPLAEVTNEAEAYRQQILENINTTQLGDSVNPLIPFDTAEAYYLPDVPDASIANIQASMDSLPKRGKKNKQLKKYYEDQLNKFMNSGHKIYFRNNKWDSNNDLHERSHGSTKGELSVNQPYNFRDLTQRREGLFGGLEQDYWAPEYTSEKTKRYLTDPTEIKARKDLAAKILQEAGLYDPVNENFTDDHYNHLYQMMFNYDIDPALREQIKDIVVPYNKNETIRMFNDIVQNNSESNKLPRADMGLTVLESMLKSPVTKSITSSGLVSPILRRYLYSGFVPASYEVGSKIKNSPRVFMQSMTQNDTRPFRVGVELSLPDHILEQELKRRAPDVSVQQFKKLADVDKMSVLGTHITKYLEDIGRRRLDAWATGLLLPQEYDTLKQIGEDTYTMKDLEYSDDYFSKLYRDLQAHSVLQNISDPAQRQQLLTSRSKDNPLVKITEDHYNITPHFHLSILDPSDPMHLKTRSEIDRELFGIKHDFGPWQQERVAGFSTINQDPKFKYSIWDNDTQGVMGGFRWDVAKDKDLLHFQANDVWDLHPFEKRTTGMKNMSDWARQALEGSHHAPLENFEALSFVGGRPFKIQNDFFVDPKTFKVVKRFRNGGDIAALDKFVNGGRRRKKKKDIEYPTLNPDDILMPGEEAFPLPIPEKGEQWYEPITIKPLTEDQLLEIAQETWTDDQWKEYYAKENEKFLEEKKRREEERKIEQENAYQKALINEPNYFNEAKQFVTDWHNSPMYTKMVLDSYNGQKGNADYLTKLRKKNLETLPNLTIKRNQDEAEGGKLSASNTAAWSMSDTGQIETFPAGFEYGPSLYTHEILHSSDRPRELYKWDHPAYNVSGAPSWMTYDDPRFPNEGSKWFDRLMPYSDQMYITTHRGRNYKDNQDYKNKLAEGYFEGKDIPSSLDEAVQMEPEYWKEFASSISEKDKIQTDNNLKKWKEEAIQSRKKEYPGEWKEFGHGYVSDPTEVRARLGEIRMLGKKEGIYDPFTEELTPEKFQEYINKQRDENNWQPMKPIEELRQEFTDEEILWMLNHISQNTPNENEESQISYGKFGGSMKYELGEEVDEATMKKLKKLGYTFEKL